MPAPKKLIIGGVVCAIFLPVALSVAMIVRSDAPVSNATAYLRDNQDSNGQITGWDGESEWAAIGLSAEGVNVADVKNPTTSLRDFLSNTPLTANTPTTDLARRILAIVAIGGDPTQFGGTNSLADLQSQYTDKQLGDTSLLNDDIYGLLALLASGNLADHQIKQDKLSFILAHQAQDGGFSWSADPSCVWCFSESNETAVALQSFQAAKNAGFTNPNLDSAITNAKTFLLSTQQDDGGFGYDVYSDSDGTSTALALIALNSLGLGNSLEAQSARAWLLKNQESDGGFHWMPGAGSDTATTSYALTALSGKSWILHVFGELSPLGSLIAAESPSPSDLPVTPPVVITNAETVSATTMPTMIPTPVPVSTSTPNPTPTSISTATPVPTPAPTPIPTPLASSTPTPTLTTEVLGASTIEPTVSSSLTPAPTPIPTPPFVVTPEAPNIFLSIGEIVILSGVSLASLYVLLRFCGFIC